MSRNPRILPTLTDFAALRPVKTPTDKTASTTGISFVELPTAGAVKASHDAMVAARKALADATAAFQARALQQLQADGKLPLISYWPAIAHLVRADKYSVVFLNGTPMTPAEYAKHKASKAK